MVRKGLLGARMRRWDAKRLRKNGLWGGNNLLISNIRKIYGEF